MEDKRFKLDDVTFLRLSYDGKRKEYAMTNENSGRVLAKGILPQGVYFGTLEELGISLPESGLAEKIFERFEVKTQETKPETEVA